MLACVSYSGHAQYAQFKVGGVAGQKYWHGHGRRAVKIIFVVKQMTTVNPIMLAVPLFWRDWRSGLFQLDSSSVCHSQG